MKKILVTGIHSYLGDSFAQFMSQWAEQYKVSFIDLKDSNWVKDDFK